MKFNHTSKALAKIHFNKTFINEACGWVLLIFLFTIISCNQKKSSYKVFEGKHFDIIESRVYKKSEPLNGYYFDKKNKLKYFYYKKSKDGSKEKLYIDIFSGEVIYPDSWELKNDSLISIMGFDYYFESKDSFRTIYLFNSRAPEDHKILRLSEEQ